MFGNTILYFNIRINQLNFFFENLKLFIFFSNKIDILKRNLEILNVNHLILEAKDSDRVDTYKPVPEGIIYIINKNNLNLED